MGSRNRRRRDPPAAHLADAAWAAWEAPAWKVLSRLFRRLMSGRVKRGTIGRPCLPHAMVCCPTLGHLRASRCSPSKADANWKCCELRTASDRVSPAHGHGHLGLLALELYACPISLPAASHPAVGCSAFCLCARTQDTDAAAPISSFVHAAPRTRVTTRTRKHTLPTRSQHARAALPVRPGELTARPGSGSGLVRLLFTPWFYPPATNVALTRSTQSAVHPLDCLIGRGDCLPVQEGPRLLVPEDLLAALETPATPTLRKPGAAGRRARLPPGRRLKRRGPSETLLPALPALPCPGSQSLRRPEPTRRDESQLRHLVTPSRGRRRGEEGGGGGARGNRSIAASRQSLSQSQRTGTHCTQCEMHGHSAARRPNKKMSEIE